MWDSSAHRSMRLDEITYRMNVDRKLKRSGEYPSLQVGVVGGKWQSRERTAKEERKKQVTIGSWKSSEEITQG